MKLINSETFRFSPTTRQKEILTGSAFLILFFGGFLVGEIGLRVTQMSKFGVTRDVETSDSFYRDKVTGLRVPRPNQKMGKVRINNLAYRGPDISEDKDTGVIRVAFLGSSTTYEPNSPEGQNWPHVTVERLRQAHPKCRFDYINAGLPGFGTDEMQLYYETKVRNADPDLVIILPGDINQDLDWLAEDLGFDTTHHTASFFAEISVLWDKLERNFVIISRQRSAHQRHGKLPVDLSILEPRFKARLESLIVSISSDQRLPAVVTLSSQLRRDQSPEAQARAANTNLFYMPYVAIPDLLDIRDAYNKAITQLAETSNAILIAKDGSIPADLNHYVDTMHFSPAGSSVMADRVVAELSNSSRFVALLAETDCTG